MKEKEEERKKKKKKKKKEKVKGEKEEEEEEEEDEEEETAVIIDREKGEGFLCSTKGNFSIIQTAYKCANILTKLSKEFRKQFYV
ncbi:hypothetical protein M8J77_015868 [Diaphorina citri]|nr:hypothetical protein M8J77_015868 [Diaphorina citri]